MAEYWWVFLAVAWFATGAGAILWLYTAIDLTRVVAPSTQWLARESRYNIWGNRLMAFGATLAVIGVILGVVRWLGV